MRVGIFIDGVTLFYGLNCEKLHFSDFKKWLLNNEDDCYAGYFTSVDVEHTKAMFFSHVEKSGFQVFSRKAKYNNDKKSLDVKNMGIELTTEAMHNVNCFDKFILVSGKYDFLPLCERLASMGKIVEIVGFKNNINKVYKEYQLRYVDDYLNKK